MAQKVILVTGSSRGIGLGVLAKHAKLGYAVVMSSSSGEEKAADALAGLRTYGVPVDYVKCDISQSADRQAALDFVLKTHGRIDVLVNNAGVTADGLFMMMGDEEWHKVINTTLNGFFNVTKPVLREMIRKKRGAIVYVASISAVMPNRGQANYAAAKSGVNAASSSLAKEVARFGIRVNVVAPGPVDTDMLSAMPMDESMIKAAIPMARVGKPEEIARVIRFLCSDDASFITGQVITVNGGMF